MSRYYREGSSDPQGNTRSRAGGFTSINNHNDRDREHDRDRNRDRDYDRDYDRDRNRDRDHARDRDRDRRRDDRDDRDNRSFRTPLPTGSGTYHHQSLPPRPPTGPSGEGDSYRPSMPRSANSRSNQSGSHHPPQADFNFRFNAPETVQREIARFERDGAPPLGPSYPPRTRDARTRRSQYPPKSQKPIWRKFIPAERDLLSGAHADAPTESLFDPENGITYRALDELSDSDEADMDISDGSDSEGKEPSQKRARVGGVESATGQDAPKWSNPDPYTAVPPGGASQAKKKDVVQLIRKARVQAKDTKSSIPSEAADFISCDFDDSDDEATEYQPPAPDRGQIPSPRTAYGNVIPLPPKPSAYGNVIPLPPKPPTPMVANPERVDLGKRETVDLTLSSPAKKPRKIPERFEMVPGPFPPPPLQHVRGQQPFADPTPSSLGNRKRTRDDRIKTQFAPKKGNGPSRGYVTDEWMIVSEDTATPWFKVHEEHAAGSNEMLHQEVVDFYHYARPRQFEEMCRTDVVERLKTFCRNQFGDAEVYPFGSYPSGLYLPTGDMDLAFLSDQFRQNNKPKYNSKQFLWKLKSLLASTKTTSGMIEVIAGARVPLVKFVDFKTQLKIDVSFENQTGIVAINTFLAWKRQYPAMPVLVTLIKQFLTMRGLNEPVNGGIGGFSIIALVVSLFQLHPEAQTMSQDTRHNMGKLLLTFLDFYGNHFEYENVAICLEPPMYIPKNEVTSFSYKNTQRLSIIDPNNPENDVAGGSSNFHTVVQEFSRAHHELCVRMQGAAASKRGGHDMSILFPILAGNYSSFDKQRRVMERLARGL